MTFVTAEEEFILRKAVEQADSEGKEILMSFCRNRPIPQNCDEEATVESDGKNENATVENGASSVPKATEGDEPVESESDVDRQKEGDRETATGIETEILRGKPSIKDVQKVKHVVYVNKDRTSVL